MRNMSFFLTTEQVRERTKTVTRRLGWKNLKPGERFRAVRKGQGLRKGEKLEVLVTLECVSNRAESLCYITDEDCAREGFPKMNSGQFIRMFCEHMGGVWDQTVQRIEFKYVD